jgi:hypothetical protein
LAIVYAEEVPIAFKTENGIAFLFNKKMQSQLDIEILVVNPLESLGISFLYQFIDHRGPNKTLVSAPKDWDLGRSPHIV